MWTAKMLCNGHFSPACHKCDKKPTYNGIRDYMGLKYVTMDHICLLTLRGQISAAGH